MGKQDYPMTQAVRELKNHNVNFIPYVYQYEEKGGTAQFSQLTGIAEHSVIKTIVLQSDEKQVVICLQHGDKEISLKELARIIGVKTLIQCDEKTAMNATGYQFGGTSPFGTRKKLRVFAESTIFDLERIYINGGKRGFIIEINTDILENLLRVTKVNTAI